MDRSELRERVSACIGRRQLVFFGTRGDDVEGADLAQLTASVSLIGTYASRSTVYGTSLEDLTGERVDLDTYEVDDHLHEDEVVVLRRSLLRILARESVVFTYRPSNFLSSICFARRRECHYLGLFKGHQAAFEHKPWVESEVARLDIPCVEWSYVADEEQRTTLDRLADGPVLLRRSRTNGGTGLVLLDDPSHLAAAWPDEVEGFVSVSTFLAGSTPVNVGAVVWDDEVSVHPASIQLIGVPELTSRRFGYCGNDFGAVAEVLDDGQLARIEYSVRRIGAWLRSYGYRGAFGVDFLVVDGEPRFVEINPRFQGSTRASCQISVEADLPCVVLEHLAAHLGLPAPVGPTLSDLAGLSSKGHLVVHWRGREGGHINPSALEGALTPLDPQVRLDVPTRPDLLTAPGATICRLTTSARVTETGFDLLDDWRRVIRDAERGWA